jgi:predicted nucleotide-binding protein
MINGKQVNPFNIERFKINKTKSHSSTYLQNIFYKRAIGPIKDLKIPDEWYVTQEGADVSDYFIIGPPGYKMDKGNVTNNANSIKNVSTNKVFIVHGHNEEMKQTVARTVEKLGLESIILHEQANQGKTIIEKFEKHSYEASFAIVLLSSDDKGCTVNYFPAAAKFRARQNVILELGYFIGKLGRERVLVIYKESKDFELPSDITGVLYISYDKNWKFELVKELQACGYKVDANKIL